MFWLRGLSLSFFFLPEQSHCRVFHLNGAFVQALNASDWRMHERSRKNRPRKGKERSKYKAWLIEAISKRTAAPRCEQLLCREEENAFKVWVTKWGLKNKCSSAYRGHEWPRTSSWKTRSRTSFSQTSWRTNHSAASHRWLLVVNIVGNSNSIVVFFKAWITILCILFLFWWWLEELIDYTAWLFLFPNHHSKPDIYFILWLFKKEKKCLINFLVSAYAKLNLTAIPFNNRCL